MCVDSGMYFPQGLFPPVAKIDEYVALVSSPFRREFYQVIWLEPIPLYEKEFLVAAGSTSSDNELSELVVNDNEILQLRLSIDGIARAKLSLPRAARRYVLKNYISYLEPTIAGFPRFTPQAELAILEDNKLYADVTNLNQDRYERVKIYFTGYRLVLKPIREKPPRYAAVVTQGFGGIRR